MTGLAEDAGRIDSGLVSGLQRSVGLVWFIFVHRDHHLDVVDHSERHLDHRLDHQLESGCSHGIFVRVCVCVCVRCK